MPLFLIQKNSWEREKISRDSIEILLTIVNDIDKLEKNKEEKRENYGYACYI